MGLISVEEKTIAVKLRLKNGESFRSMGVQIQMIRDWYRKYQSTVIPICPAFFCDIGMSYDS